MEITVPGRAPSWAPTVVLVMQVMTACLFSLFCLSLILLTFSLPVTVAFGGAALAACLAAAGSAMNLFGQSGRVHLVSRSDGWRLGGSLLGDRLVAAAALLAVLSGLGSLVLAGRLYTGGMIVAVTGLLLGIDARRRLKTPYGWDLTPSTVRGSASGKTVVLPWDAITSLDETPRRVRLSGSTGTVSIALWDVRSDRRIVHDLLQYYRRQPADRAELGDERVLERLRRGDLDAVRGPDAP